LADQQILTAQTAAFANSGRPGLKVRVGQPAESSPTGKADPPS
jgi:hypothetical protein